MSGIDTADLEHALREHKAEAASRVLQEQKLKKQISFDLPQSEGRSSKGSFLNLRRRNKAPVSEGGEPSRSNGVWKKSESFSYSSHVRVNRECFQNARDPIRMNSH